MGSGEQLTLNLSGFQPAEPYALLADAIDSERAACDHGDPACSVCLADLAVRALRDHVLDVLADDERYEDWYRANVERLDEIDEDMTHAAVVAHYLVEVVLPSGRSVETVTAGDLL